MQLKRKDYLKILPVALRLDRSDFVHEFVERGLKFSDFIQFPKLLTNLAMLYDKEFVRTNEYYPSLSYSIRDSILYLI